MTCPGGQRVAGTGSAALGSAVLCPAGTSGTHAAGASAARCGARLLASRVFGGAGREHVAGQWLQVAMSDTAMGGGVSPCFFGGGARRAATLVAVRPWVTATLIVQTRPRLGLRGRPAVWRSTASERWLGRGRRGRSTSW